MTLSIEDAAVSHDCPRCAIGFDIVDLPEQVRLYLERACGDLKDAEQSLRHCRRRLHEVNGRERTPGQRNMLVREERAILTAIGRLRESMGRAVSGEPMPDSGIDLWAGR